MFQGQVIMIEKQLLERQMKSMENLLKEIEQVADKPHSLAAFKEKIVFKRFIERNIELAIEKMISIGKHIISSLDLPEPETYAGTIDVLATEGIIPQEHNEMFKSMVRYRNILVHGYDNVDDDITYNVLKNHLSDFLTFISDIRCFMNKT